jgi:hypothetical protein
MPKKTPYLYCLLDPPRRKCCRVTDGQPCEKMAAILEQLETELTVDGEINLETHSELTRELLPRHNHGYGDSRCPAEPTTARAGTPEKIEIMRLRVERGESPFHPKDPHYYTQHDPEG